MIPRVQPGPQFASTWIFTLGSAKNKGQQVKSLINDFQEEFGTKTPFQVQIYSPSPAPAERKQKAADIPEAPQYELVKRTLLKPSDRLVVTIDDELDKIMTKYWLPYLKEDCQIDLLKQIPNPETLTDNDSTATPAAPSVSALDLISPETAFR
jgi:hypothetical protein